MNLFSISSTIAHALTIGPFIALAALQPSAHAQANTAAAKAPVYCEGDSWRIAQTEFMKTGLLHVKVAQTVRGGNTSFDHTLEGETARVGARIEVRNAAGNRVQLGDVRYAPDNQAYQFPLTVGKSWAVDSSFTTEASTANPTGGYKTPVPPSHRKGTATVVTIEKVTTPAGVFDAYRIEQKGTLTQPSTQGSAPTFDSQYFETNWYAPAAKAYIKYEYRHDTPRRTPTVRSSELVNATVKNCE